MTKELLLLRTDAAFDAILDETNNMIKGTGIEKLVVPRVRRPPKRFDGNSQAYQAPSILLLLLLLLLLNINIITHFAQTNMFASLIMSII